MALAASLMHSGSGSFQWGSWSSSPQRSSDNVCPGSGRAQHFDDFLKLEKEFAPISNQLFITKLLWDQLGAAEKKLFVEHRNEREYGAIRTALYRMRASTTHDPIRIVQGHLTNLTEGEWHYLREHLRAKTLNVAARNEITVGLIEEAAVTGGSLTRTTMTNLTLSALHHYLTLVYPDQQFRVALWRPNAESTDLIRAQWQPPESFATRSVRLDDPRYQVVRAFHSFSPLVTACLDEARLRGQWQLFDTPAANLIPVQSSIQMPIFRSKPNQMGKEAKAVLSVDCDKPDFFMPDAIGTWSNELIGFLANLSLAEHLRDS